MWFMQIKFSASYKQHSILMKNWYKLAIKVKVVLFSNKGYTFKYLKSGQVF